MLRNLNKMILPAKLPMTHQTSGFIMTNSLCEPEITPKRMCANPACQEPDGRLLSVMINDVFNSSLANYGTGTNVDTRKPLSGAARWSCVIILPAGRRQIVPSWSDLV